jgi:hypothetical protein
MGEACVSASPLLTALAHLVQHAAQVFVRQHHQQALYRSGQAAGTVGAENGPRCLRREVAPQSGGSVKPVAAARTANVRAAAGGAVSETARRQRRAPELCLRQRQQPAAERIAERRSFSSTRLVFSTSPRALTSRCVASGSRLQRGTGVALHIRPGIVLPMKEMFCRYTPAKDACGLPGGCTEAVLRW